MNYTYPLLQSRYWFYILCLFFLSVKVFAQPCPTLNDGTISTYPNTYYPGTGTVSAGSTLITVGAAGYGSTSISYGDFLLVIQMQGAKINSTNTNSYGDGVSGGYGNGYSNPIAGNYEYVFANNLIPVTALLGGTISLYSGLVNKYKTAVAGTNGQYTYQVIRVPFYQNLTLAANITAPPWNGSTGGVIALQVNLTLYLGGFTVSADGAGFRGGGGRQLGGGTGLATDYVTLSSNNANASKGEGIAGTPKYVVSGTSLITNSAEGYPNGSYAMGAPGNAGGGGTDGAPTSNADNSGGGGGGNGGAGGKGGNSWSNNLTSGGEPGAAFTDVSPTTLVMGGGGGAGTTNDGTGTPGSGLASSGAPGGGIIIINTYYISGTGTVTANGSSGNTTVLNDGSGGGGGGGSVLVYAGASLSGMTVTANGGTGGSNSGTGVYHGPGGGGGGGVIYSDYSLNASSSVTGGASGYTVSAGTAYGSAPGSAGVNVQNITLSQISPQSLYCTLLPVHFIAVSAINETGYIDVKWDVTNEVNVASYIVQRSSDGFNFFDAGTVGFAAPAGANNTYNYDDYSIINSNTLFYRIKQVNTDGTYIYSTIAEVKLNSTGIFYLSPNPAKAYTVLTFSAIAGEDIFIRVFDARGSLVVEKKQKATPGINSIKISTGELLAAGIYTVQLFNGASYKTTQLLISRD